MVSKVTFHYLLVYSPSFDTFIIIDTPWTRITVDVIRDQETKMNHVQDKDKNNDTIIDTNKKNVNYSN